MKCSYCGCFIYENESTCSNCGAFVPKKAVLPADNAVISEPVHIEGPQKLKSPCRAVFFQAIRLYFRNYLNFKGRSTRSEFNYTVLFTLFMYVLFKMYNDSFTEFVNIPAIYWIATLIPSLALISRRSHDTGTSSISILFVFLFCISIPVFIIALMLTKSSEDNKWGEAAKNIQNKGR